MLRPLGCGFDGGSGHRDGPVHISLSRCEGVARFTSSPSPISAPGLSYRALPALPNILVQTFQATCHQRPLWPPIQIYLFTPPIPDPLSPPPFPLPPVPQSLLFLSTYSPFSTPPHFSQVKSADRSVEKVVRVYRQASPPPTPRLRPYKSLPFLLLVLLVTRILASPSDIFATTSSNIAEDIWHKFIVLPVRAGEQEKE